MQADQVQTTLSGLFRAGRISEALIATGLGRNLAVVCISIEHLIRYYLVSRARRAEDANAGLPAGAAANPATAREAG